MSSTAPRQSARPRRSCTARGTTWAEIRRGRRLDSTTSRGRGCRREENPEHDQDDRGDAGPERRPADHGAGIRGSRKISAVVGRGVHPADAETGHDDRRAADEPGAERSGCKVDVAAHDDVRPHERHEHTVSTANAHVNKVCIRTIVAWPRSPITIVIPRQHEADGQRDVAGTHPSRSRTVCAANAESATRTSPSRRARCSSRTSEGRCRRIPKEARRVRASGRSRACRRGSRTPPAERTRGCRRSAPGPLAKAQPVEDHEEPPVGHPRGC